MASKKKEKSTLIYFLSLLSIAIILTYVVLTHFTRRTDNKRSPKLVTKQATSPEIKTQFTFYQQLKTNKHSQSHKDKFQVPHEKNPLNKKKTTQLIKNQQNDLQFVSTTPKYQLQIASFQDLNEAKKMQAKLALQGVTVNIMTFKDKQSIIWYRLRTSKCLQLKQANAYKVQLSHIGIPSLVIETQS